MPALTILMRDLAANRPRLLGQPHLTHAAFAEPLQETIGTETDAAIGRTQDRPEFPRS